MNSNRLQNLKLRNFYFLQRLWNLEQSYTVANVQPTPTTITPIGQNLPVGYERKLRRISPVHEPAVVSCSKI